MKKTIVVVSLFSGFDFLLKGCLKAGMVAGYAVEKNFYACLVHRANYLNIEGKPVMEDFVPINAAEYTYMRNYVDENGHKTKADQVGIIDGQHYRTKTIEEINGYDIRQKIEAVYGSEVIIVLIGGPPCQDYSKLNKKKRQELSSRNFLVFEFLRILRELNPDAAIMEEVPEFRQKGNERFFNEFIETAKGLPYHFADMEMNALHYQGHQSRKRSIFQFIHRNWNKLPVFPKADTVNLIRAGDFLDIDHFHSGHFTDTIKTAKHFMCTVTKGSPLYFLKNQIRRSPTIEELLLCMDIEPGELIIPAGIPIDQQRRGIGNGVCVNMAFAIASTMINHIFGTGPDNDDPEPPKPILPVDPSPGSKNITITSPLAPASVQSNGKIINSTTLQAMQFDFLDFDDIWEYFFGLPAVTFLCIIHGLAGDGKSTFAILFAKYLADHFGRTLYISAEEGFSLTFQNKFDQNNANSLNLDVADFKTVDQVLSLVPKNTYRFIFIDSLDTMKIDTGKLKRIRAAFKGSALITISQATKQGQMRGSYEIVHDSDIAVRVSDGIAETIKNRFQVRGRKLNVFATSETIDEKQTGPAIRSRSKDEVIYDLKIRLENAVSAEDYEQAAKLRDQLNKLKNDAENNLGS